MSTLDDVLAQCLADIEAGKTTVEQCLARHPEQAMALRPLLHMAIAVRTAPAVEPSPAFAATAHARLMNMIAARRQAAQARSAPARGQSPRQWSATLVKVTAAVVLAVALMGGTAYAARDSMPDSPLYPVKRTVESVQIAITPNDVRRARAYVNLLDRRAIETAAMLKSNKIERSVQTTTQYVRILKQAEAIAERVPANRAEGRLFLTFMRERLSAQQAIFQRILANGPERGKLLIRPILVNIQRALDSINSRLESA
jgi:hypothetical protein